MFLCLLLLCLLISTEALAAPASQASGFLTGEVARAAKLVYSGYLFGALLFVALLVNLINPEKRNRIRRSLYLFLGHIIFLGLSQLLLSLQELVWADRIQVLSNLLGFFVIVQLVVTVVYGLTLPKLKVKVTRIATELSVGFGYFLSAAATLSTIGVNASDLLTTSAVVTAVIGLSLQKTLGNVLGGVALQLDNSISVDDWVQIGDSINGRVAEIRWRHTVIETRNFDTIIVPNATLLDSNITIWGKRNNKPTHHRMWVYFGVDFRYAPNEVIETVEDALRSSPVENVASDPSPNVVCMDFLRERQSYLAIYAVRYFLVSFAADDPTSSRVRDRIYFALQRKNIPMGMPTSAVINTKDNEANQTRNLEKEKRRRMEVLDNVDIFDALSEEEKLKLAESLVYAPFAAGEYMIRQGNEASRLYLLAEGSAEIKVRDASGNDETVTIIYAPTVLGEMALLTGEPRAASVVAKTHCECFRLEKSAFEELLRTRPAIAIEVSEILAERKMKLQEAYEQMDQESRSQLRAVHIGQMKDRIQKFFGLDA